MAKKMSELLAEAGLTADDIIDDEFDLPVGEVRKRLKTNQKGYTEATQAIAERDRQLKEMHTLALQWQEHAKGLEGNMQTLEQRIAQRAEQVQREGGDWRRDPLFNDLVADFDRVDEGIKKSETNAQALAMGMYKIAEQYNADRKRFYDWADTIDRRFMKMDNPDFDADEVKKWAQENGVQDSWENAYKRMKASKLPEREEQIRKEEREKVLAEHGDKLKAPVETEMGGTSRPSMGSTGTNGAKKDYKDAWGGLAAELGKIGRGSA